MVETRVWPNERCYKKERVGVISVKFHVVPWHKEMWGMVFLCYFDNKMTYPAAIGWQVCYCLLSLLLA